MSESKFSNNAFLFKNTKQNDTIVQLTDFFKTVYFQTLHCLKLYFYSKIQFRATEVLPS